LAPLQTEFIRIRYASAADVFELFGGGSSSGSSEGAGSQSTKSILSERGTAIVDERTNSIILTETADKIAEFKLLIEQVDIPIRQVMIEARIVVADDDFSEALGIDFNASSVNGTLNDNPLNGTVRGGSTTGVAPTTATLGNFGIGYISGSVALDLELSALQTAGYSEVVAQPKVITGDKQQASIETGQEIPFTSSDGDDTTTIFKDAVLKLDVTPQITPDNRVIMDLQINQDSIGELTPEDGPTINVTELTTRVLVGDGQTIVLGGIFQESKTESESKVPLLGDIPFVGRIFKSNNSVIEKRELLVFITPRILADSFIDK